MDEIYKSTPVNTAQGQVRLISIDNSLIAGLLSCTLITFSLGDTTQVYQEFLEDPTHSSTTLSTLLPEWTKSSSINIFADTAHHRFNWGDYAALSYAWGIHAETTPILLNGVNVHITRNLAEALNEMRQTGEFSGDFRLWVDALSINQGDDDERNAQVALMRVFFSQAWSVIGFLGHEAESSNNALNLLRDLASICESKEKCEKLRDDMMLGDFSHVPGAWLALKRLTLRPYWRRLWIMQEAYGLHDPKSLP